MHGKNAGKSSREKSSGTDKADRARRGDGNDIGKALRTVYQDAVSEDVPSEMLDLLKKLK